jgi:hypothetical protein
MNALDRLNAKKSLGGAVGGLRRTERLSPERRQEIARKAAEARWDGKRQIRPAKRAPGLEDSPAEPTRAAVSTWIAPDPVKPLRPWSGPAV